MVKNSLTVKNKTGLHARPASQLAQLAQKFESTVRITDGTTEIDSKSVISIMSGGFKQGTAIELIVEGSDEEQAAAQLSEFINALTE
ncbi:MAG: HPr family phosphocarrier protein [Defluviitaleaceae bacterium]|nr:HPr family phosphocarrier protein [Defluviitaleaceae bacterium]